MLSLWQFAVLAVKVREVQKLVDEEAVGEMAAAVESEVVD